MCVMNKTKIILYYILKELLYNFVANYISHHSPDSDQVSNVLWYFPSLFSQVI